MTRPVSVLFLLEDLCYGGTQRQMLELARRLDRARFAPELLTLAGPTDMDAAARSAGLDVRHLGRSRRVPPLFFLSLGREISRRRPDVIIPCTALPNIWGRIWGRILGIPCLGTVRGGGGPKRQHERFLWRLADRIICNSAALRDVLSGLGVPRERIRLIPNGVDTERFAPANPPPSQRPEEILCVARLAGDKDHETLFRALALVRRTHADARLRLVGDGPREAELHAAVREMGLEDAVIFTPGTDDVRPFYAGARVFALSSVREGQPNVLLEAMACALPAAATHVGGIPALLDSAGLTSPAGDADALAGSILRILEDPALADELGRRGRRRAESECSFAAMTAAHEEEILACVRR